MTVFQKVKQIVREEHDTVTGMRELFMRIPEVPASQKEYFKKQLYSAEAGFKGEKQTDSILESIPAPPLHHILPNFQTRSKYGSYYQMDTLILTNRYVLLFEIKNIRGILEFRQNPDHMIRTYEGIEEKMNCPIHQLNRNHHALSKLLHTHYPQLPIYSAIVFTNSNTRITSYPHKTQILYKNQIEYHLSKLNQSQEKYDKKQFQQLVRTLRALDRNFVPTSLVARYSIDQSILKRGVFCKECHSKMLPLDTHFRCVVCNTIDKDALKRSLVGLFKLVGPDLSIQMCKDLLEVQSKERIQYALKQLKCTRSGRGRASRYRLE